MQLDETASPFDPSHEDILTYEDDRRPAPALKPVDSGRRVSLQDDSGSKPVMPSPPPPPMTHDDGKTVTLDGRIIQLPDLRNINPITKQYIQKDLDQKMKEVKNSFIRIGKIEERIGRQEDKLDELIEKGGKLADEAECLDFATKIHYTKLFYRNNIQIMRREHELSKLRDTLKMEKDKLIDLIDQINQLVHKVPPICYGCTLVPSHYHPHSVQIRAKSKK